MSAAVRIVARLRPPLPGEVCDDGVRVVSHHSSAADSNKENTESKIVPAKTNLGPGILVLKDPSSSSLTQQSQHYPFHSAYCPEKWLSSPINPDSDSASTKSLFIHDVLPLVDQVLSGATVTVFAYGVTSSGKTYTMQGNGGDEDRGIIGMVVQELFKRLDESTSSLSMSYLELYLDTPFDLLVPPTQRRRLQILSTSSAGTTSSHSGPPLLSFGTSIHLPNLSTHPVDSPEAFQVLYADAMRHRSTGATLLNSESSRSHAVLTLYVTTTSEQNNVGKLHLLDLAGSENNNLTGNNPERMKESSAINKSLTALGQVVNALNDNAKIVARAAKQANIASAEPPKLKRIPYRSSSLTRLLSDALGGTSLALLIVCLAPGTKFRSDLVRSVGFASQARRIENKTLPPPPPPAQPIKVPTSKTFDFAIPFRPSSGSSSNSNSSNSNTITFTSSSDKAKFPSSTNLSSDTSAFSRPRSPPARPIRPARSTRSARPRASSISRDARKVINKNNLLLSPLKSTTSKRRTRRISFIPVPQGSGSRGSLGRGSQRGGSGKLSMILEGLPRPRASAGGRLENPSEHSLSGDGSVGAGYAGSGSGSGSGVVMTEEEIQERISKALEEAVEAEVERRLAQFRAEGLLREEEKAVGVQNLDSDKEDEINGQNTGDTTEELREEIREEVEQEVSMMMMDHEEDEQEEDELDDMDDIDDDMLFTEELPVGHGHDPSFIDGREGGVEQEDGEGFEDDLGGIEEEEYKAVDLVPILATPGSYKKQDEIMKKEEQVFGTGLANGSSFDNDSGTRRISIRLPPSTIVKQESEQDVVEETLLPALIVLPASGFEPVIQPFMKQEVEQEAGKDVGLDVGQDMRQEVEMEQEVVREVKQEVGVGELPVLVPNSSLGSLHQSPTPDPVAPIEPIQRIDPVTQRRSRLDRYSNQREDREDLVVKEEEQDAKVEENVTAGMDEHVDMLQDNSFDMLEGDVDMLVDDKVDDFKNLMDFRDLSSVEATNSSFISTVPQVQEAMHMPKPMDLYYAPVNAKNVIHIRGSNSGQQDEPREEMDEQEDNDDEKVDELIDDDAEDMNMDWGTSPTVPPQSAPTSLRRSSRFKPAATASASVTAVETYSPAPAPISVLTHTRVTPARASTSRSKSNSRIMSSTPLPYPANPSTSPFAFLSISPAPVSSSSSTSLSAAPAPKSSKPRKNGKTMNLGADKQRAGGKTHSTGKTTSGGAIKPAPSHISPAASARNAEMGRAYLLQRIRAESTNPTQALAYYRHAATFVPNNDRLRDRYVSHVSSNTSGIGLPSTSTSTSCFPLRPPSSSRRPPSSETYSRHRTTIHNAAFDDSKTSAASTIHHDYKLRQNEPVHGQTTSISISSSSPLSLSISFPAKPSPSLPPLAPACAPHPGFPVSGTMTAATFMCGFLCAAYLGRLDEDITLGSPPRNRHPPHTADKLPSSTILPSSHSIPHGRSDPRLPVKSVNLSRSSSSLLSTKTTTIYGSSTEKHKIMISGISGLPSPMTPHKTARISKSKLKLSNVQTMSPSALDSPPTPPTSPTPTSLLPSQIPSKRDAESGPPPLPARKTAIPVCRLVQVST